jgi:hypothetical protein
VTSARIVSDAFFFDFNHATCDGVRNTAIRSVFFSFAAAIAYLAADIVHLVGPPPALQRLDRLPRHARQRPR